MVKTLVPEQLGVCSWSVQPGSPAELVEHCRAVGLDRVQLALGPVYTEPATWGNVGDRLAEAGVEIVSGMFAPAGEDYTTPATIRETGGIVPDATWEANREAFAQAVGVAKDLNLDVVSTHAGFIPEDANDPKFDRVVKRLQELADVVSKELNGYLLLETGQETAETLLWFLSCVDRESVGVNFDPANMLLYDMGDPVEALKRLTPKVGQVHLKDATRPTEPGAWGEEVPVGQGQVHWGEFLGVLAGANFRQPMVIEREAGSDRVGDIRAGAEFIRGQMAAADRR